MFNTERIERINFLISQIGNEISDNFSPTLRSTIDRYVGNGNFVLKQGSYERAVGSITLDTMVFGC